VGSIFICSKLLNLFPVIGSPFSVKGVLKGSGAQEIETNDINSQEYHSDLEKVDPDIIFSISCPQLFKKDLINLPEKYCLNAHGTLLPRHRGVFGTWWTLFENDSEAGATIHTIELKLDSGKILWQDSFKIQKPVTQFSLAYRTKKLFAEGFVDLMHDIASGDEAAVKNEYEESYHKAPTRKEGKRFHKQGKRIIVLKDIPMICSRTF